MKKHFLSMMAAGLFLVLLTACCVAAPAPPHLAELAPFEFSCREFGEICSLVFSADGRTLFSTHDTNSLLIWDVASRDCRRVATLKHPSAVHSRLGRLVLSPDGKTMAYGCGRVIKLWDVARCKEIGSLEEDGDVCCLAFHPDSKTLIADIRSRVLMRHVLRIWDVEKKKKVQERKTLVGAWIQKTPEWGVEKPVLTDIRPRTGQPDSTVSFTLLDAVTGQSLLTCAWQKEEGSRAHCFALNRAKTMVASAGSDSPVQLWDWNSGKRIARSKPLPHRCRGLDFSPDGMILAAWYVAEAPSNDSGFVLYDARNAKILAEVKRQGRSRPWAFSPDGRLLAVDDFNEIKLLSIPEQWRRKDK